MFHVWNKTNPIPYPSLTLVLILVQRRNRPSSASKHLQLLPQTIIQPTQCHKSIAYLQCGEVASHCSPDKNKLKIKRAKDFIKKLVFGRHRKRSKHLGILWEERCDILHLYAILKRRCSNGSSVYLFKHLVQLTEFCSSTDPLPLEIMSYKIIIQRQILRQNIIV